MRTVQRRPRRVRSILLAAAIAVAAIPAFGQQALILVRHAEQVQTGGGMMDGDPPLNEVGRRRAASLAENLKHAGVTAIVTSQYQRARQTAEPLAAALRIEPAVVPKDDVAALAEALKARGGRSTVLVVGHSDTIPALLKALGHSEAVEFPRAEFNNAWLVVPRPDGAPVVTRVSF